MHLFYTPEINSSAKEFSLNEEESKHCVNVLRLQAGTEIKLIDGRGNMFSATILLANSKKTTLVITACVNDFHKVNHYLHIAVAPTKSIDRFEWFLEKATEIGIDEITPLICNHSERREIKVERLEKIIISAIKQSVKAFLPKLNKPVEYKQFINQQFDGQKFIAHCADGEKKSLRSELSPGGRYLILIGPEGDFSPGEITMALDHQYFPISLGINRLRTETAALAACFEVNFLNR